MKEEYRNQVDLLLKVLPYVAQERAFALKGGTAIPIHELLNPVSQDQAEAFERQFSGMTLEAFTYETFEKTREKLIENVRQSLNKKDIQFLLSFKKGEPDWDLFEINKLKDLPAVKWKLLNIQRLKKMISKNTKRCMIY